MIENITSKIQKNKQEKKEKLLNSAYQLFGEKGFENTSIQDIVKGAGVAKGTFYLYFSNKDDIRNHLISTKTTTLFNNAIEELKASEPRPFDEQIIFTIDYVLDELVKLNTLTKIIDKDLSLGFYSQELTRFFENNELGLYDLFLDGIKKNNISMESPEVTFFMIVELVGATCFKSLTHHIPSNIENYKPYLFKAIKALIHHT